MMTSHPPVENPASKGPPALSICFVGTPWLAVGPEKGGIPKMILELSRVLSRDHDVHILCPKPASEEVMTDDRGRHFHYAQVREVPVYPIPEKLTLNATGLGLLVRMIFAIGAIFAAYARMRREYRFDVTMLTNKFVALPILALFRRQRREVFIYSEQNIWPWLYSPPPGMLARFRYVANAVLGVLACQMSDAIHANSDSIRDGLLRQGVSGRPVAVIPNGVDMDFQQTIPAPLSHPIRVAFVGRLVEDKGVQILVDVIRKVETSGRQIHFVIFGDGPLRSLVLEARGQYSTFLGDRPREEVLSALRSVHIALFLSRVQNIPHLALLEALALGKAVIATNVGDTSLFLSDRQNALLCQPDPDAVVRAILNIADDNALYARLSSGAQALAAANSWGEIARRHLIVFTSLIRSAGA